MRSMISGSKFVLACIAGSHALKSSSIPQEGETGSTDVQTPVLTVDSLVKDVEQKFKEVNWYDWNLVGKIKKFVDEELAGNILGTNNWGQDLLFLVCRDLGASDPVVLVELLLSKYKCNPNTKEKKLGNSALMFAAYHNRPRLVKLLVQHGADVDNQNDNKNTALHVATQRGYLEVVSILFENNADTSLKDRWGETAWQVAQTKHKHEVVAIFKSHEYRKSFAVVLGLNHYTTQQIIAPNNMPNDEGLFKVDKSALLNILSFLKIKGE